MTEQVQGTATIPLADVAGPARPVLVVIGPQGMSRHELSAEQTLVVGRGQGSDLRIDDPGLSRRHAAFTAIPRATVTDLGSSNGTRVGGQVLSPHAAHPLREGDVVELGTSMAVMHGLTPTGAGPRGTRARTREIARRIARTDLAALIVGPPGVGKLHLARQIHGWSGHADASALEIECPGLGPTEVERVRQRGAGTTVILHRVDDTPASVQGPLVSALEHARARTVATSRTDPELSARRLRLYQRLLGHIRGVELRLPGLDADDDPVALVDELVRDAAVALGMRGPPTLDPGAIDPLRARPWPRNVHDLRAVVRRTVAACLDGRIGPDDWLFDGQSPISSEDAERQRIIDALAHCGGNQTKAAKFLKISRRTLVSRLDKYKIVRPRKRS